jgi:hypothetical protein
LDQVINLTISLAVVNTFNGKNYSACCLLLRMLRFSIWDHLSAVRDLWPQAYFCGRMGRMNEASLLLNAYYETLYERLQASQIRLAAKIEELLQQEIEKRGLTDIDADKYAAYRDACLAFVQERLETYNPVGIQYTFDRVRAPEVFELEMQLSWYDSQAEFEALRQAARDKAETHMTDERVKELVDELIKEAGAYPDNSIISAYEAAPTLSKLPDYIVGRAIEEILR